MNIAQKARIAAIVATVAILLSGCSTADPSTGASGDGVPRTAEPSAQAMPENVDTNIVKVVTPTEIVVTAIVYDDPNGRLYDQNSDLYGKNLTVIPAFISAPKKGDCGFDDALAYAKKILAQRPKWTILYSDAPDDIWIDAQGDHHGTLSAQVVGLYAEVMITAGFAYIGSDANVEKIPSIPKAQQDAQASGAGLWGTCPNFGQ